MKLKLLNDTIHEVLNKDNKSYIYSNFTKLIYECITWINYKQLVIERNILKTENIMDKLTSSEKNTWEVVIKIVINLIIKWFNYNEIKNILLNNSNQNVKKRGD